MEKIEKTIKQGDILNAALKSATSGKLAILTSKAPIVVALIPVIAFEIENTLFGIKDEEGE